MDAADDARRVLHPIILQFKVYFLVSFWLESGIYGLYFCLFVASLNILRRKKDGRSFASRVFFVGILAMFILITFHNALNVYRMLQAYAYQLDPNGATFYLRNLDNWDAYAFPVVGALITWTGDILVIFRCFIIWENRIYVIAVPVILLVGSIVTTIVNLYWFSDMFSLPYETVLPFLNATFPLNFAQNVLTTGLIAFKLWRQHRASQRAGIISSSGINLLTVVRIIIESALVYTIQMLILVVLFAIDHPAHVVVQHALVPSTGIVFVLISIRTHAARSGSIFQSDVEMNGASLVPSWMNGMESNHDFPDPETRRLSRSNIPFVTTAVEQHHLEDMPSTDSGSSCNK